MSHPLRPLFYPRAVAVVGASPKGGYGLQSIDNLRAIGFAGQIYPVNPNYAEIAGLPAYPCLSALPGPVDAVAIAVPALSTPGVVRDAVAADIPTGVIYASGFAEVDGAGRRLQAELQDACQDGKFRFIGPNCLGVVSYAGRSALWGISMGQRIEPGHIGFVAQSGNMALTLMMAGRGLKLAHAVSCGNQASLDAVEVMDFFLHEEPIQVIAGVVEGLSDIGRFRQVAALAAEREVPMILLKLGRSEKGRRAAVAHTGSMTGSDALYDALFRQYGVIRVNDLEELMETAKLLAAGRIPAGSGLSVFASSGGECGMISDLAAEVGLELPDLPAPSRERMRAVLPEYANPGNPLDITATGWGKREVYGAATRVLAELPAVDMVACIGDSPGLAGALEGSHWDEMIAGLADGAAATHKPVVAITTITDVQAGLSEAMAACGIPLLSGGRMALTALANAARYGKWRQNRAIAGALVLDPAGAEQRRRRAAALLPPPGSGGVGETVSKRLLELYGVPVAAGGTAGDLGEALDLAAEIGYPVVLKIAAEGIYHKTEVGGVALNLGGPSELKAAYDQMMERVAERAPGVRVLGVRVEQMAGPGVELIVGGGNDQLFGPYIMAGAGGVLTELLRDTAQQLAPVSSQAAAAMLEQLRSHKLLAGFRGQAPRDAAAAAELIARVSQLLAELPEVKELDINPVLVRAAGEGCMTLDCLVVV